MADTHETLAALVVKHDRRINATANLLADLSAIITAGSLKCTLCEEAPATVKHALSAETMACDACAAREVIGASKRLNEEFVRTPLVVFRGTDAKNDLAWIDLPNAVELRRVVEYVRLIREGFAPQDPPHGRMH